MLIQLTAVKGTLVNYVIQLGGGVPTFVMLGIKV